MLAAGVGLVGPPAPTRRMPAPSLLEDSSWLSAIRRDRLALLLDLDGTLIPFAARAEDARLDGGAVELLGELATCGVQVVIVTGRPQRLVNEMCDRVPRAWWFAEHGAWHRTGGGWTAPHSEVPDLRDLAAGLTEFLSFSGTRVEHKTVALALHWRTVAPEHRDAAIAAAELACEEWLETRPHCERIDGVEMLEVRLRSIHKGTAVARVRERLP
jgi:trehalose-phosphatase